ncbi:hypothetical protein TrVFT333_001865 [Trichoderma virens FT-333]|nr:hypothetical protein TrVFT333_001865 [Trichoderma virens FT-333]
MDKFMHTCIKFFMLVTKLDFSSAYAGLGCSDESNPSTALFQCALFTILCHAVFFANLEEKDKKFASGVFWKCAKFFMTEELLKTSCVAAVQTLLIISVAYNGSTFGVKGRKIPADLACRIARSLGIDNEDDQPASAAAGVQGANRQTWYGCIMMNLISKLPLSHDMSSAPSVITPGQLASGSVDFSFFTNCVNRIEELEKLLEKMRRVREPILEAAPNHGYNSFDTVVPELREKLREFVDSLTSDISWGVSGLPDEYIHMHEFEKLITASNANFFYLRAMLFRPILMQKAIEGSLQSGSTSHKPDSVVMDKTLASARGCLNAAGCLIFYIYKRFWIHLNGNKEWWWSPYHTSTAGLILIMAQTSASLWSKISGNRVLENNYSAMPHMKYQMALALRNPLRTPFTIPVNPWSPSPDSKSISQPTSSDSDRKAPMEVLTPNMSPSASRNDDASSSNTAPFPSSASSMDFNPMSSATSEMAPSGPGAVATATFSNYNTDLYGSSSGSGTAPPFAASWNFDAPPITAPCNFDTAPFTALLNFDAVPPAAPSMSDSALLPTTSTSTAHPASTSSGSVPSSLPLDPSMTPHVASEYAAALYNVASNPNMVPFMASSDSTIVPFATSLNWNENWNGAPCAAPSESVADPHAGPWNPNTVPAMSSSWVSPAPYAGPYTVFSDPNATLYTEESLDSNASPRSEVSAFNPPPSSSNTMPGPLPSDPNAANFGNTEGMGDPGTEPQALIQASTEDLPLNIYYNLNDDPFVTGNWQS